VNWFSVYEHDCTLKHGIDHLNATFERLYGVESL